VTIAPDSPLLDRVEACYGSFLRACDEAADSKDDAALAELIDATDVLMRALAQVLIQASNTVSRPE
jgi:hypothetical protein